MSERKFIYKNVFVLADVWHNCFAAIIISVQDMCAGVPSTVSSLGPLEIIKLQMYVKYLKFSEDNREFEKWGTGQLPDRPDNKENRFQVLSQFPSIICLGTYEYFKFRAVDLFKMAILGRDLCPALEYRNKYVIWFCTALT